MGDPVRSPLGLLLWFRQLVAFRPRRFGQGQNARPRRVQCVSCPCPSRVCALRPVTVLYVVTWCVVRVCAWSLILVVGKVRDTRCRATLLPSCLNDCVPCF